MANLRRTRKRVHGIPRAADGSAFQKCNTCGASVPIALAGMHECDLNPKVKRFKGVCLDVQKQSFYDQLIVMSPFNFFMKEFTKTSKAGNWVAINREGFEAWKNMSEKERQPYVAEAEKVDKAYEKALLEEADNKLKVDDEADSAMAGNNEKAGEFYGDYENSDGTDELWDNYGRAGSWQTYARPIGIQLAMVENLHPEIIFPLPVFSKGLEALYSSLMDCACSNFRSSSLLLLGRSPSLHPHSSFPSKLRFLTLKRLNLAKHARVVRSACGFNENGSVNGFSVTPNKLFMQEAIGAEYGEGFETFRPDGPLKVDVDFLNDRLQEGFLQRIRYAMKPDEAYGLIFSFDNVVADTRTLKLNSWKQLASEEGKEIPEDADVQGRMLYAGADHVLHKLLLWDEAEGELDRLALRFSQLYYDNLLRLSKPVEGLKEWLDAVSTARIPCAVVSSLDRINMTEALERMELKKYFQAIVTEEDGMDSIAHRFLSAAMKLDRKPSKCVVFEDEPRGIAAAHNCTMMAVALIGVHPAYDLVQADLAVASFNELSVINLRRLFANKGSTFMDLQKQVIEKSPPKRKLTIDTIF